MLSVVREFQSISPVIQLNVERLLRKMYCIELYTHSSILKDSRDDWITRHDYSAGSLSITQRVVGGGSPRARIWSR